jgi:hypothetical protein
VADRDDSPPLVAATTGQQASVMIQVRSPWVIEGLQNDLTDFTDNTDGAVVSGWFWRLEPGDHNSISLSTDGGRSWQMVWENSYRGAVPFEVDLTARVHGRYSYLVRFDWTDNAGTGRVGLQGLKVNTWAELSPMALPRLVPGKNEFDLSVGNHRALLHNCFWRQGESLPGQRLNNLLVIEGDDHCLRLDDPDGPGELIFSPGTDGLIDELRLAFFVSSPEGGNISNIRASLSVSTNNGTSWQELESYSPHQEHELGGSWFNHIIDDRVMVGANTLIKLTVNKADLRTVQYSVLERRNQAVPSELQVTHAYRDSKGSLQEITWSFPPGAQDTSYEVDVPQGKIYNHSVTFEAVSPGS